MTSRQLSSQGSLRTRLYSQSAWRAWNACSRCLPGWLLLSCFRMSFRKECARTVDATNSRIRDTPAELRFLECRTAADALRRREWVVVVPSAEIDRSLTLPLSPAALEGRSEPRKGLRQLIDTNSVQCLRPAQYKLLTLPQLQGGVLPCWCGVTAPKCSVTAAMLPV